MKDKINKYHRLHPLGWLGLGMCLFSIIRIYKI